MGQPFDVDAFRTSPPPPPASSSPPHGKPRSRKNNDGYTNTRPRALEPKPAESKPHAPTGALNAALAGAYPLADGARIAENCAAIEWAISHQADVPEPYWHGVLGVAKLCEDGDKVGHQWSCQYPGYDPAETQAKLDNWKGTGATLCTTLADYNPRACATCQHRGKIKSPIVLGYRGNTQLVTFEPTGKTISEPLLPLEAGLLVLSKLPPPKRLWAVDKLIALGKYAVLAGLGGISKTILTIVWGVHVALGKSWAGLAVSEGAVLMLLGEEDRADIAARFGAICRNMTDDDRRKVQKRVLAFPWNGKDMRVTMQMEGNPMETHLPTDIIMAAHAHAERCGAPVRLIVLDHARLAIGGNPNDAEHVTEVTRVMTKIADATGAAVVLIAHSPKTAITKGKSGEAADAADVAGSIAWVDNARAALVLTTMREDEGRKYAIDAEDRHRYAKLQLVKANYAPTGWECWLQRVVVPEYEVAIPTHVLLVPPLQIKQDAKLEARILELVADMPGQLSPTKVRDRYSGLKKKLLASEGDVETATDKLLSDGRLIARAPTAAERTKFGLSGNTRSVLVVPN